MSNVPLRSYSIGQIRGRSGPLGPVPPAGGMFNAPPVPRNLQREIRHILFESNSG
jgi:hypothetical protein